MTESSANTKNMKC